VVFVASNLNEAALEPSACLDVKPKESAQSDEHESTLNQNKIVNFSNLGKPVKLTLGVKLMHLPILPLFKKVGVPLETRVLKP
jgi:hypothetical protein